MGRWFRRHGERSDIVVGAEPGARVVPPQLLDAGVTVTLNADDPLLFGASLGDEYRWAREVGGLDDNALADLARASVHHSHGPSDVRARLLDGIDRWLAGPIDAGRLCRP